MNLAQFRREARKVMKKNPSDDAIAAVHKELARRKEGLTVSEVWGRRSDYVGKARSRVRDRKARSSAIDKRLKEERKAMKKNPTARRNHHLIVGERVKYSDEGLWNYQMIRALPLSAGPTATRGTVVREKEVVRLDGKTVDGYVVAWDKVMHRGRDFGDGETWVADKDVVSANSTSRKWPGNHYEGIPPKKNPKARRNHHLVVGERVKLSDEGWAYLKGGGHFELRPWEFEKNTSWHMGSVEEPPYRDAPLTASTFRRSQTEILGDVVGVTNEPVNPNGYFIVWDGEKKDAWVGDKYVVSANSTTRKWPGNNYEGITPKMTRKNPRARRNTHLIVGEPVKWSTRALEGYGLDAYQALKMKGVVRKVLPDGYMIELDHLPGRSYFVGDKDVVSANSTTRKWPGNHYEGVDPMAKKNPKARRNPNGLSEDYPGTGFIPLVGPLAEMAEGNAYILSESFDWYKPVGDENDRFEAAIIGWSYPKGRAKTGTYAVGVFNDEAARYSTKYKNIKELRHAEALAKELSAVKIFPLRRYYPPRGKEGKDLQEARNLYGRAKKNGRARRHPNRRGTGRWDQINSVAQKVIEEMEFKHLEFHEAYDSVSEDEGGLPPQMYEAVVKAVASHYAKKARITPLQAGENPRARRNMAIKRLPDGTILADTPKEMMDWMQLEAGSSFQQPTVEAPRLLKAGKLDGGYGGSKLRGGKWAKLEELQASLPYSKPLSLTYSTLMKLIGGTKARHALAGGKPPKSIGNRAILVSHGVTPEMVKKFIALTAGKIPGLLTAKTSARGTAYFTLNQGLLDENPQLTPTLFTALQQATVGARKNPKLGASPTIGHAQYYRQPTNAGPYTPQTFPYGYGGRPATYKVAKENSGRREKRSLIDELVEIYQWQALPHRLSSSEKLALSMSLEKLTQAQLKAKVRKIRKDRAYKEAPKIRRSRSWSWWDEMDRSDRGPRARLTAADSVLIPLQAEHHPVKEEDSTETYKERMSQWESSRSPHPRATLGPKPKKKVRKAKKNSSARRMGRYAIQMEQDYPGWAQRGPIEANWTSDPTYAYEQFARANGSGPRGGYSSSERDALPAAYFLDPKTRSWPVSDANHAKIAIQYMTRGFGNARTYPTLIRRLATMYPVTYQGNKAIWSKYNRLRSEIAEKAGKTMPTVNALKKFAPEQHFKAAANSGRRR